MKAHEAKTLAAQLGLTLKGNSVNNLCAQIKPLGLEIAVENPTGDWVILDSQKTVKARCN